jgi:Cyclic nucleotide-binding domain
MAFLRRKQKRGSRRIQLDDASADAYIAGIVAAAAEIRLPSLFAKARQDAIFSVPDRQGIAVTALKTTSLSEEELVALMRFRLAQYVEVNFVDANAIYERRLDHEPLDGVYPDDIHLVAGSVEDGEILCYATMKAPPQAPPGTTLRTQDRPLFPVEKVHGFGIYNRLPILPDLPITQIRELGRFVKNQRYHGVEDKSVRGPVEVGVAMFRIVAETLAFELSGVIGDLEEAVAKQNIDFFHVPLVVMHGTMPVESEDSWLFPRYLYRTVFPFALLASDAATALPRLAEIEGALSRPGKLGLLGLMRLRGDAGTDIHSSLSPEGGLAPLLEQELPQKGVAMSERREVREAGARLRETELFTSLSEAEAAVLGTFLERVDVGPETTIVRQGDPADALYIVESGEVEVRSRGADGTSTPVATIGAGDYFGEVGVVTGGTRIADVVAVEPTTLLRLSKDDYESYLAKVVEVEQQLGRTAATRAGEAARRVLDSQ